jgi:hypothetical protein
VAGPAARRRRPATRGDRHPGTAHGRG